MFIKKTRAVFRFAMAAICLTAVCAFPAHAAKVPALELEADANATLDSINLVEKEFITIDYKADYALDEALAKGVADKKALEAFISEKLTDGLPFNYETLRLACSTFAATTTEGDHIMARNMDLAYSKNFLVHTKPKNGYESLSMTPGYMLGYTNNFPESKLGRLWTLAAPYYSFDGINEKGLSVAILLVQDKVVVQNTGKAPITTTLAVRMILDKAATVDEALALLEQHDMRSMANTNFHYHIADANGNSVVVEYVDNKISVVRPTGFGHPVTNYYLTPGLADKVIDGQDRMEKLVKALDETRGVVSNDKAWKMLDSVKAVHDYDEVNKIDYMTAYSILYNNSKRTMDICIEGKFDKIYSFTFGDDGFGKK
ncbi:linear amide C-N hydrolase [Desulfovibrio sp. OttesenSCG-928-G15]|nr:linear amide C-N hydrolase [Desulfovibrio sp. OttesenSCG-928-G15]